MLTDYADDDKFGRLSIQMPILTRSAIKQGVAGHVGAGASVWSTVHVKDLARGYLTLLEHMQSAPASEFLDNPYFFCESTGDNEPSWRDIAVVVGKGLHAVGRISDPEPKTIALETYHDIKGPATSGLLGMNARSRATRLRKLGWQPVEKPWDQSFLEDELIAILQGK
jgi:nucleoside-diphosphate-sugar epimerase